MLDAIGSRPRSLIFAALLTALVFLMGSGAASAASPTLTLFRNQPPAAVPFWAPASGEGLLDVVVWAPGVSWERPFAESAVVSLWVDGVYASDLVVFSAEAQARRVALGHLEAGLHVLRAQLAGDRSPIGAWVAKLKDISVSVVPAADPAYLALRYAPVLYGRSGSVQPFQNARTDTPLLAWHEVEDTPLPGFRVIEYSVVWSNEDGGTETPALMARWGRTTDVEWIYKVLVGPAGNRVPGFDFYQGPGHFTLPFNGKYDGDHPLLQTCTTNNMVCDTVTGPMRFFLAAAATRPAERAREVLMDQNPRTYQVMAAEMLREGKVEPIPYPATPEMSDQRNYLYVEVDKDTLPPNPPLGPWVGLAVGVRLFGDPNVYRSDHMIGDWSVQRDDPAAVAVELPPGTAAADVREIIAYRVSVGSDTGASVQVTDINRAFLLDGAYLPMASFADWHGSVELTPAAPSAVLWSQ